MTDDFFTPRRLAIVVPEPGRKLRLGAVLLFVALAGSS